LASLQRATNTFEATVDSINRAATDIGGKTPRWIFDASGLL
jgi:hypothetical protein